MCLFRSFLPSPYGTTYMRDGPQGMEHNAQKTEEEVQASRLACTVLCTVQYCTAYQGTHCIQYRGPTKNAHGQGARKKHVLGERRPAQQCTSTLLPCTCSAHCLHFTARQGGLGRLWKAICLLFLPASALPPCRPRNETPSPLCGTAHRHTALSVQWAQLVLGQTLHTASQRPPTISGAWFKDLTRYLTKEPNTVTRSNSLAGIVPLLVNSE